MACQVTVAVEPSYALVLDRRSKGREPPLKALSAASIRLALLEKSILNKHNSPQEREIGAARSQKANLCMNGRVYMDGCVTGGLNTMLSLGEADSE